MKTFEKLVQVWTMIRAAEEFGVDISADLAPLKNYTGNNKYLLEMKEYCSTRGML